VFGWDPTGDLDLYEKPVDGTGNGTLLLASSEHEHAQDWSPDGRYILYASDSPRTGLDLWALPLFGNRTPIEVAHTSFIEFRGRFSPDARMVAYQSSETGRQEVYVQPFPGPGAKKRLTNGGASIIDWGPNGRELYCSTTDGVLAVSITINGSTIEVRKPVVLFSRAFPHLVSADGQRFLLEKTVKPPPPVTVLLNWKSR
jgi:Tol biopolymer transport system component